MATPPMRATTVARRLSLGLAAALLATAALAAPVNARELDDPIVVPMPFPVTIPIHFMLTVQCKEDGVCIILSSEPCAGLVIGPIGFVLDPQWGVFVQTDTLGSGPSAYGGYSQQCKEKGSTLDLGYLESLTE